MWLRSVSLKFASTRALPSRTIETIGTPGNTICPTCNRVTCVTTPSAGARTTVRSMSSVALARLACAAAMAGLTPGTCAPVASSERACATSARIETMRSRATATACSAASIRARVLNPLSISAFSRAKFAWARARSSLAAARSAALAATSAFSAVTLACAVAICASAWRIVASKVAGSIVNNTSPALTCWFSRTLTLVIRPLTSPATATMSVLT